MNDVILERIMAGVTLKKQNNHTIWSCDGGLFFIHTNPPLY
jgi:hypothetical protein